MNHPHSLAHMFAGRSHGVKHSHWTTLLSHTNLSHALTPSLSHADESMNTTDKSKLMHQIESFLEDATAPSNVDVCIVDATFPLTY